jgi:hypothetical protein
MTENARQYELKQELRAIMEAKKNRHQRLLRLAPRHEQINKEYWKLKDEFDELEIKRVATISQVCI